MEFPYDEYAKTEFTPNERWNYSRLQREYELAYDVLRRNMAASPEKYKELYDYVNKLALALERRKPEAGN